MKKISALDYIFAIGKIRTLEVFLLKKEVFEEAIDSSLPEALKLFAEASLYSDALLHVRDSQQLEELLSQELSKLKDLTRSLLLDKALLGFVESDNLIKIQKTCQNFSSEFLQDYLAHAIDMYNIKTFLRLYILKESEEQLRALLAEGGFVKKKEFLGLYVQDLSVFLHRIEFVHKRNQVLSYLSFLREPVARLQKENSFLWLEKAINDFLIDILKAAKFFTFGPEPVLAYYLAKVNEINLMRLIILAKLNNLSGDFVKERLNTVYA